MAYKPTIFDNSHFNAQISADLLHKSMEGWGCDRDKIVRALVSCSNAQRQELAHAFKLRYGKDLKKELKSELSGDFEDLALALMEPPADYDARELHNAMKGPGTKESVLIEILTTRTNAQINAIKWRYRALFGRELEADLVGDTSGDFRRVLVALSTAGRDESAHVDVEEAKRDALALFEAGEQRRGTDEDTFITVLATQNANQLRALVDAYEKIDAGSKKSAEKPKNEKLKDEKPGKKVEKPQNDDKCGCHKVEKPKNEKEKEKDEKSAKKVEKPKIGEDCKLIKALKAEFSGDARDALVAIVRSAQDRSAFLARLIYKSMKGMGTRDSDLIRLVVSRAEIDLADVRDAFQRDYKTALAAAIASECSGAYRDALVALVKGN